MVHERHWHGWPQGRVSRLGDSVARIGLRIVVFGGAAAMLLVGAPEPTLGAAASGGAQAVALPNLAWVRCGGPIGGMGYDIRMRPDNPDTMLVTESSTGV